MAYVYWIHLKDHTDITSQGYVGYTSTKPSYRWSSHRTEAKNGGKRRLSHAIRKYGDKLVFETLLEGSNDYCLLIENKLRSSENIGWNHGIGGVAPSLGIPMPEHVKEKLRKSKQNCIVTEETRRRISEAGKGRKYSEDSRNKMSVSAKNRPKRKPWENPRADKKTWLDAERIYKVYLAEKNQTKASRVLSCEYCKLISIFNMFECGWIPLEDPHWVSFKSNFK